LKDTVVVPAARVPKLVPVIVIVVGADGQLAGENDVMVGAAYENEN
jgi:hypothetical protein